MTSEIYTQLEQQFATWALTQPAIMAVIVVGSRARSDHPADAWSDLDLIAFATDTAPYLKAADWLNAFGLVRLSNSQGFGKNDREWLALYADSAKLDVAFLSTDPTATPTLQNMLDVFPYPGVLQRGVRVLIDKTGAPTELQLPAVKMPPLPDQAQFTALANQMWFDAIKAAKFIRRQDLWRAKHLCDHEMKLHLLKLLEWQAAMQEDQRDIWYDGRFLHEWADPQAVAELPATFAAYRAADLSRALLTTLDLFRRLSQIVAARFNYSYPSQSDQFVQNYIHTLL